MANLACYLPSGWTRTRLIWKWRHLTLNRPSVSALLDPWIWTLDSVDSVKSKHPNDQTCANPYCRYRYLLSGRWRAGRCHARSLRASIGRASCKWRWFCNGWKTTEAARGAYKAKRSGVDVSAQFQFHPDLFKRQHHVSCCMLTRGTGYWWASTRWVASGAFGGHSLWPRFSIPPATS